MCFQFAGTCFKTQLRAPIKYSSAPCATTRFHSCHLKPMHLSCNYNNNCNCKCSSSSPSKTLIFAVAMCFQFAGACFETQLRAPIKYSSAPCATTRFHSCHLKPMHLSCHLKP